MNLYDRIRLRREELNMSQEELALKLGYKSRSSINKIEMGKSDIAQSKISAFADALDTTVSYLMGWESEEIKDNSEIPPGFIPVPQMQRVPIVGRIACGEPITAEQNVEGYADVPKDRHVDFCLVCEGDSMIDAGIKTGDIVYIRKQPQVENGQIAAVRIDNEATLKRVYFHGNTLILQPANANYPPMSFYGAELENVIIEGLAVGFTHWF